jgi:hypothetical protein
MSKQDIEKRLGFAAQGVKAEMAARPTAKKASTDFDLAEACWEGYEAVGTKKKDGKTVPNCVPKAKSARPGPRRATSEAARSIAADLDATYGIQAWVEDAIVFVDAKNFERAKQARAEQNKKHYNPRIALRAVTSSRPGVKAKFDLTGNELDNRIAPTMHGLGHFVNVQAPRLKQNIADAAKYAKKAYDLGEQIMQSATASPETLRAFDRQVSVAKAQPGWRIANSEKFSRPGAKAKA